MAIEQRWADNQLDRLPGLVADLVRRQAAVIVGNAPAVEAARSVAPTIPIVFVIGGDPVAQGLITSLNRPGGNLTGLTFFGNRLGAKRMGMRASSPRQRHCRADRSKFPGSGRRVARCGGSGPRYRAKNRARGRGE